MPFAQKSYDAAANYSSRLGNPSPRHRTRCDARNPAPSEAARGERSMRTMLLAAAAGLSLAAWTAAYADSGDGPAANTLFTNIPGVVAQADVPNAPAHAQNRQVQPQQAQNGQGIHVYVSRSNQGTWLFAPNGNQGANS